MKQNGAEKLFAKMTDRAYAELADLPEDRLYDELPDDDDYLVDEGKDAEYYENRNTKGYGLTDGKIFTQ